MFLLYKYKPVCSIHDIPVIGSLQDHFHFEAHIARANMGLAFVSGQYGCLFSRCRKYVINSLIHGHFHIGLVIIPRPILDLMAKEEAYQTVYVLSMMCSDGIT
jgi:hypothetical protein